MLKFGVCPSSHVTASAIQTTASKLGATRAESGIAFVTRVSKGTVFDLSSWTTYVLAREARRLIRSFRERLNATLVWALFCRQVSAEQHSRWPRTETFMLALGFRVSKS